MATTIKHVVRPEDREVPGGGWVRCWSVFALRATGAVEVEQSIPTRAKARKIAATLSAEPVPVVVRGGAADDHDGGPLATVSYRPMFFVNEWVGNGQRFATREEAEASASARFWAWTVPTAYRVDESDEPVNYVRRDGRDELVTGGAS